MFLCEGENLDIVMHTGRVHDEDGAKLSDTSTMKEHKGLLANYQKLGETHGLDPSSQLSERSNPTNQHPNH